MKYSLNALDAAHHASELLRILSRLSREDMEFLAAAISDGATSKALDSFHGLLALADTGSDRTIKRKNGTLFEEFRFEDVMHRVRNAVMHSPSEANAAELDWLLRIILMSPAVFASVRELDNFLSNMTAAEHDTKSTGRDRVVDWYFKHVNSLPENSRNEIFLKIARHIFAKGKSNYREWKEVLYGSVGK